jgi:hypothetical protein
MQWIKTNSAKTWNKIHGSIDHVWGERYFAKAVDNPQAFEYVMDYIDQNPVVVGLAETPADWKASGAFYKSQNIQGLVDFSMNNQKRNVKLLSPIPPAVSRLLPSAQLAKITQYYGVYAETVDHLYKIVLSMPRIGESQTAKEPLIYLHYTTGTADYFISEYDGENIMWGKVRFNVFPNEEKYQRFSLNKLKSNQLIKLDFSWKVTDTENP